MKYSIPVIALLLGSALSPLHAGGLGFAKEDGGRPGAFLNFGAGARSLGMGKTFVGVADDASATYWNPAGLVQLDRPEITALYASLYEKTGYSFASYAYPLGAAGTIGIAAANLNSSGFQLRDALNNSRGEAGLNETAAIVSYGRTVLSDDRAGTLSAGVNLKAASQSIDSRSDIGYGLDLGLFWRPAAVRSLSAGVSLQNVLAPRLKLEQDSDTYPFSVTLGAGYRLFADKLLLASDLCQVAGRQPKLHIGGEYLLGDLLSFRLGLDETELTSGIGFKWREYSLDYAFAYHDACSDYENLGFSHRFGLTVRF
jgi:hypothetical protein